MLTILLKILLPLSFIHSVEYDNDIQRYLENKFPNCRKIEYTIVSPVDYEIKKLEIDNSRELKVSSNYVYVPIIFNEKGKTKNSVLTLEVKLFRDVLVSRRDLNKNEYLSNNDFISEVKEISALRFEPVETSVSLNLFRSKSRIVENSILVKNMIEQIPDIKVGDNIEALYINKSVSINFPVTARTEGVTGDLIRVKNRENHIFKARILNNSTVKIIE